MRRSAMPGMRRIWFSIWSAKSRLASRFVPDDLHVDRRGQAEIQNLADDVGRQKVEARCRETPAADSARSCAHVLLGGPMLSA